MDNTKNMTPVQIKAALKNAGITMSGIARDLNRSPTHISRVIDGEASHPVRTHIAECLQMPVEKIWPEKYQNNPNPTKKGRPLTNGLFNTQAA